MENYLSISEEEYCIHHDPYKSIEQPSDMLNIKLFDHQLVSVYNMERLERTHKVRIDDENIFITNFGVFGDEPGYGKSFSIIAMILRDKMAWDYRQLHNFVRVVDYNGCLKMVSQKSKVRVRASLLLASPNLIEQWKEYFNNIKKGLLKVKEISLKKDITIFNLNEYDVILISSTRYNDFMNLYGDTVVWKRFIFDDASSTRIPAMRNVSAGFVWFVSSTFEGLLYLRGNGYIKDFFCSIDKSILKHLVIKNDLDFLKKSFIMPKVIEIEHKCLTPSILKVLGNHVDAEVMELISGGDIRGAISRLGGGMSNDGNLVHIVTIRNEEKLHSAKNSLELWTKRKIIREIEFWTKRVKDIEDNIMDLKRKYVDILTEDCSICYSEIDGPVMVPCCNNIFCGKCILKCLNINGRCPMCRAEITVSGLIYIEKNMKDEEKVEKDRIVVLKQKHEKVLEIVSVGLTCGKKFLLFSNSDETFHIIRRVFDDNNIQFVEISGSKSVRDSKLKKFHEGKINVVFINSSFNGAGLNLQDASDIIFYHQMDILIRDQNIGRALRIGRNIELTVHNLIY